MVANFLSADFADKRRFFDFSSPDPLPFSFNSRANLFQTRFFALTRAYDSCIFICMRTTLNIDDQIMSQASRLTGVGEKTKLVHMGLRSIIEQESARRLAKLGGTEPGLKPGPRRRSS